MPNYLFCFRNETSKQVKYFNASDTSSQTSRYNLFVVTDDTTEDLDNAIVDLSPTGEWSYTIYEQASPTNKDPNNATSIVETGIVKVVSDRPTNATHDIQVTYSVHEPS